MDAGHEPAQTADAVLADVLGAAFLPGGIALTRRPRH
jgi:hypothetical protein